MAMMTTAYSQLLRLAMPEVIVVVAALVVLALDVAVLRNQTTRIRFAAGAGIGSAGCCAAIVGLMVAPLRVDILGGMFVANSLTQFVQIAVLVLTIVTLLLSVESRFTEHVGEFVLLILLATVGLMFLVGSQDILVIFLALELLSLSLYVLTAFDKGSAQSSEAGLKYFLFGGVSSAFLLFGFSLLYGVSGFTNLTRIAVAIHGLPLNPLVVIAMVTTAIGFGFKVAAAPFHFWAPDVYEGAPMPVAAFIASASKVASFFIFFQIMLVCFRPVAGSGAWMHFAEGWVPPVAVIAAVSMVLGNLVAIVQTSMRRLVAYSAVAHAGYMLVAVVAHTPQALAALLYYVVTYGLGTVGIFAVIGVVERQTGSGRMSSFNGLSRRAPVLSVCLLVFFLSLAGIPPLAGFFGKFYLFVAALNVAPGAAGLVWLVVLAIAMSAVSLYYYLQVLKRVFVAGPEEGEGEVRASVLERGLIVLLAVAVVVLGCAPQMLLGWIVEAIRAAGV
jgi:NADH-quinone oxidoreductase subunit N